MNIMLCNTSQLPSKSIVVRGKQAALRNDFVDRAESSNTTKNRPSVQNGVPGRVRICSRTIRVQNVVRSTVTKNIYDQQCPYDRAASQTGVMKIPFHRVSSPCKSHNHGSQDTDNITMIKRWSYFSTQPPQNRR